jgi:hypothetical protein
MHVVCLGGFDARLGSTRTPGGRGGPSGAEAGPGRAGAALSDAAGVVGERNANRQRVQQAAMSKTDVGETWSYRREWPEAEVQV